MAQRRGSMAACHVPYFSMCSRPPLPNIWGAPGALAKPRDSIIICAAGCVRWPRVLAAGRWPPAAGTDLHMLVQRVRAVRELVGQGAALHLLEAWAQCVSASLSGARRGAYPGPARSRTGRPPRTASPCTARWSQWRSCCSPGETGTPSGVCAAGRRRRAQAHVVHRHAGHAQLVHRALATG